MYLKNGPATAGRHEPSFDIKDHMLIRLDRSCIEGDDRSFNPRQNDKECSVEEMNTLVESALCRTLRSYFSKQGIYIEFIILL